VGALTSAVTQLIARVDALSVMLNVADEPDAPSVLYPNAANGAETRTLEVASASTGAGPLVTYCPAEQNASELLPVEVNDVVMKLPEVLLP
jgi:hypothetical protein